MDFGALGSPRNNLPQTWGDSVQQSAEKNLFPQSEFAGQTEDYKGSGPIKRFINQIVNFTTNKSSNALAY